jgi:PAS domain S-box-containing protein
VIGVAVDITSRIHTEKELHRYRDHLEELVEARTLELERTNERLKRFRFALDSAADNIYIIDPETMKFVDHNDSAVRALGYSREELLTMGPADIQTREPGQEYLKMYQDVRAGITEVGMFETHHRRRNGDVFSVEIFVRAFEMTEGQLLIATVRDITRRKEIEDALKDSESKNRNVLENANEAIIVLKDNLLKFFNYKVLELTGLREEDLLDLSILEFVHPDDHATVRLQYEKRIAGHHLPESYDVRMFDSNGTIKWMEVRDVLITWEGESATLNFFNDISARKIAEQYIRFQASLLSIVRNSVIAIDQAGRVTYWNAFAEILYGWPASEIEGKKLGDISAFGISFMDELLPILKSQKHWEGEVTRTHREGHALSVYTMWNAIEQEETVTGYVGIGIDMTERKKLERELLQSQKLASLGILSEGIAHELRNPLGYASSAAQLLMQKKDISAEQLEKYSNVIHTGVEKANKIVENLLLIGKPKGQLMKKQLDLLDAIEEAHKLTLLHELGGNVTFTMSFKQKPLYVMGNKEMIVQLFYNLFANAFHAMGSEGSLSIEGCMESSNHIIRVTDSGPGIPADIVENIFDPFFTTSKTDKGVGLGLTLCYFIMDDHDGRIELDQNANDGATFILTFPAE